MTSRRSTRPYTRDSEVTTRVPVVPAPAEDSEGSAALPHSQAAPTLPVGFSPSPADPPSVEAPTTEKSVTVAARVGSARAMLTVLTGVDAGRVLALDSAVYILGRGPAADFDADDPGVSRHHARVTRSGEARYVLEDTGSTNGTYVGGYRVERCELRPGDRIQLGPNILLRFSLIDETEEELQRRLFESSTRDALTRAYNRKYLMDRLVAEVAHARRHEADLAVLMVDLDHFKKTNDAHGHLVGDHVLRTVAVRIASIIRVEDVFARYGGEEFVILARSTPHGDAVRLAERARLAVEELSIATSMGPERVTLSVGVASVREIPADAGPNALLALADARLYRAKAEGRNRVCSSS